MTSWQGRLGPIPHIFLKGPVHVKAACPAACANQDCSGKTERVWDVEAACAGRRRGRLTNLELTGWLRPASVRFRPVWACMGTCGHISQSSTQQLTVSMSATLSTTEEERRFWSEFIEIYREYPCLWKIKSKEYSDKVKRNVAYDLLVEKLKEKDGAATRELVTKKINNMRSSFRKEFKKVLSSMKSGTVSAHFHYINFMLNQVL